MTKFSWDLNLASLMYPHLPKHLKRLKYFNTSLRLIVALRSVMAPPSKAYLGRHETCFTCNDCDLVFHIASPLSSSRDNNNLILHCANPCTLLMTTCHHLPLPSFTRHHLWVWMGWVFGVEMNICCGTINLK